MIRFTLTLHESSSRSGSHKNWILEQQLSGRLLAQPPRKDLEAVIKLAASAASLKTKSREVRPRGAPGRRFGWRTTALGRSSGFWPLVVSPFREAVQGGDWEWLMFSCTSAGGWSVWSQNGHAVIKLAASAASLEGFSSRDQVGF